MKFDRKSLGIKLWIYFSLFAAVVLIMIWLLQITFLGGFYESMKIKSIEAAADEIAGAYGRGDFEATVDRLAFKNSILVYVTDQKGGIIYTSDEHGPPRSPGASGPGDFSDQRPLPWDYNDFLNRLLKSETDTLSYTVKRKDFGGETMIYGVKLPGGAVLYISTSLEPLDATASILSTQLIYVTVISLLLGFIIAFFISKRLSRPIIKITNAAGRLAGGDYSVRFEKGDYSEIDALSDTLNYTALELSKAENLRRELIANISHDLRTPLTLIKGYTEMIEEISGDDPEKRKGHLSVIKEETTRLERLVSDILDLSVLQAGCENVELQNVNLSQTVRNVIARFKDFSEYNGYTIVSRIEHDQYVLADEPRMEQVLYNLIGNAVNYTGEDKTISVSLSDKGGGVRFEVVDDGDGIAEEDLPYIWDRYYKSREHTRLKAGTGIGLSIVKNILILHNADFGVNSEPGQGSVFWFELKK